MKTSRQAFRARHEQLLVGFEKDPYKATRKPRGTRRCTDCGAAYHRGRWTWRATPLHTPPTLCPACRRIRERMPAGFVALSGPFVREHRDEVLGMVRRCESAERRQHPLQRIMAVRPERGGLLVTTTDPHLARRIGDALYDAYKGDLLRRYSKNETLLRVTWTR